MLRKMLQPPSQGFVAITKKMFLVMSNLQVHGKGSSGELPQSNLVYVRRKYQVESDSLQGMSLRSSMAPGPTSSEAENVFPVSRRTQSTRIHPVYRLVHGWPHRSQTEHSHKH